MRCRLSVVILIFVIGISIFFNSSVVKAANVDDILKQGKSFFYKSKEKYERDSKTEGDIGKIFSSILGDNSQTNSIIGNIFTVGNVIFVIMSGVLGVKYIFASVDVKADIKQGLIPFSIGAIFFYLGQSLYNFFNGVLGGVAIIESTTALMGQIFSTFEIIINICAIIGILMVGLKYMFTAPDEKAQIKQKMVPLVIGICLVYSSVKVITFIVDIGKGILN